MKKNDFRLNAVILPLVLGIIFGVVFFAAAKPNISRIIPISEGTELAYFDEISENRNMADFDGDLSALKSNDLIGTVKILGNDINVKYDCDYSNMPGSLSMSKKGTYFGEVGCVYLSTFSDSGKILKGETEIDIESVFGTYKYKLMGTHKSDNEFKILSTAPDISHALVIYYQESDGAGLSPKYNVLVYEEVG